MIYLVEGAGGDRDFDNNLPAPRGPASSFSLGFTADQDDSASGTQTLESNLTFPIGPASWLDTNLTNVQMSPFFPNAGAGPKITARFKAKVFSFGDVVVDGNSLTHYQISEPLQSTSSATSDNPYPYGTDVNGNRVNDPIPGTLVDPSTGTVVTQPAEGTPTLLDKFTVTKPDIARSLVAKLSVPPVASANEQLKYEVNVTNNSPYALNGTQVVLALPSGVVLEDKLSPTMTQQGQDVVLMIGRLEQGAQQQLQVRCRVAAGLPVGTKLLSSAVARSSTALPVNANRTVTRIIRA